MYVTCGLYWPGTFCLFLCNFWSHHQGNSAESGYLVLTSFLSLYFVIKYIIFVITAMYHKEQQPTINLKVGKQEALSNICCPFYYRHVLSFHLGNQDYKIIICSSLKSEYSEFQLRKSSAATKIVIRQTIIFTSVLAFQFDHNITIKRQQETFFQKPQNCFDMQSYCASLKCRYDSENHQLKVAARLCVCTIQVQMLHVTS